MQTIMHKAIIKWIVALLLVAAVFGSGPAPTVAYAACGPVDRPYDLWAKTGTTTLYTGSPTFNIWGYSLTSGGAAAIPGPVLEADEGECVGVTLHNVSIPGATALVFQGQNLLPDTVGVTAGGSTTYTFTASDPGTFLYEAGLIPNSQTQVAMGLYGALVVNSSTAGQAYNSAISAYDSDEVLVLSELDSTLNANSNPYVFDLRNYKPKYFLINGKAYPGTLPISAMAGDDVLFRYVNAGLSSHAMSVLGFSQRAVAEDGSPYTYARSVVSESIPPGGTLDAIGTIPASASDGSKFALYDANLLLRNNTGNGSFDGFGGMITFVNVGTNPVIVVDTTGPVTNNVGLPANPVNGSMTANLTASVTDLGTPNSNVTNAEYFIDSAGANGTGTGMTGTFGTPGPIAVSATISGATIGSLSSGNHTVYVHGQDSAGNWGSFALNTLKVDNAGPSTTGLGLTPNPTNGTVNVTLTATGNDTTTGNSNITAAEYFIDSIGANGSGAPMTVLVASPNAGLTATILAATVNSLAAGSHTVYVHSRDALNQWGPTSSIPLTVDKTGPASTATAAPTANNGSYPLNSTVQAVRVTGNFTDASSNIAAAELFVDTVGAVGSGNAFAASDGNFNGASESGYADIPLVIINSLTSGNHTIYIRAKDSAGNWGSTFNLTYLMDRTAPTFTGISASPNPTLGATSITMTVAGAADPLVSGLASGVAGGEYWFGTTDPAAGGGTPFTGLTPSINISTLSPGSYTLRARIRDAAGNWSTGAGGIRSTTLVVSQPPMYFSTTGNTNPPGLGGTSDDADIYFYNGAAFSRAIDVTAITNPLPTGANVDGFDRVSATQFYMSFSGGISVPGISGTVQDEDIVMRNGTTWTLYFDGSVNGLTSGNFDLDAISIVGAGGPGNVYFSTDNGNVPPGAGGTGDDADIYRWNGGSSYTRVVNASGAGSLGLPGGANVDGVVWVDATHFYLSFNADTAVPVLGTVQDEDVVYYNNGVWSVYFDGTAVGLTSANLDIDAFDLP